MNELVVMKAQDMLVNIIDALPPEVIPDGLKQRDKREPGRMQKMTFERRMARAVYRRFKKQKERLVFWLSSRYMKTIPIEIPFDIWDLPEDEAEIIRVYKNSYIHGIGLIDDSILMGLDYSVFNEKAAAWAKKKAGELIKQVDDTSKKAVQTAVSSFVETPGMTLKDVIDNIPFEPKRAERIAATEITNAYGKANLDAGLEMKKEFPDVRVVKIWYTNQDEKVCDICDGLDGEEVEIEEQFSGGYDSPAAHVNCRCWMQTRTRI